MDVLVGVQPPAPAETARQNVLALNAAMFGLYDDSGRILRKNILARHPLILGLFTGGGGRFILYKPGAAPVEAPSVPIVYQLMKSVGHATMVISVVARTHHRQAAGHCFLAPRPASPRPLHAPPSRLSTTPASTARG